MISSLRLTNGAGHRRQPHQTKNCLAHPFLDAPDEVRVCIRRSNLANLWAGAAGNARRRRWICLVACQWAGVSVPRDYREKWHGSASQPSETRGEKRWRGWCSRRDNFRWGETWCAQIILSMFVLCLLECVRVCVCLCPTRMSENPHPTL